MNSRKFQQYPNPAMRTYKIIGCIVATLLIIPLLTHYYLNKYGVESQNSEDGEETPAWVTMLADVDVLRGKDLKLRLEELLRIKHSVTAELRGLEAKRQKVQTEISLLSRRLEEAKSEIEKRKIEMTRLQISIQQAHVAEKEAMERNTPRLGRPKPLNPLKHSPVIEWQEQSSLGCDMDTCFDYSKCPIASMFKVYIYPGIYTAAASSDSDQPLTNLNVLRAALNDNVHATADALNACVFVALVESCNEKIDTPWTVRLKNQLSHWNGDGRNHLIWLHCSSKLSEDTVIKAEKTLNIGRAIVLSEDFEKFNYRQGYDVVVSHWEKAPPSGEMWSQLPTIVPAKRKYLATYLGGEIESSLQSDFLKIQQEDPFSFVFQFSCDSPMQNNDIGGELRKSGGSDAIAKKLSTSLCENEQLRTRLLLDSTFSIILLTENREVITTRTLQRRLHECLKHGAIPVIIGVRFQLPYSEVIDWSRISILFPVARITELHYYLKSFTDSDLLGMRKNGRLVFEKYLSTVERVVSTTLGTFRTRLGIAPVAFEESLSPSVFNSSFKPLKLDSFTLDPEEDENLGPIEPSYPSPSFMRNFTNSLLQKYDLWNVHYQPFKLYPFTPWDLVMPSEAKFKGSSVGFRPVAGGAGGSGKEFSESLGGNTPKEQFTIVMLTYEREQVLMNSLQRLFALPYLNRVVVVWNSPQPPNPELKWPDIGVPVHVVKTEKNSLNNRFQPFDVIETEAILSIDDDAHLRHDEIVFGFRVWRENRDRIVGFPGRYHAWDLNFGGWLYNSNYSCELSMVLTGAAFYHKIYTYLYTYDMPSAIRDKVDELMNCEDIAMNFLISHVTQKPPVKVTSRWTFRCPGCPVTLSEDDSHFQERHHCINFFSKVYGYTPLTYTQFRADSVLFKTRIPHDKQKCFKYI